MEGFDLDGDGVPEMVIGRSNGMLEVYRLEKGSSPELCCKEVRCLTDARHECLTKLLRDVTDVSLVRSKI